MAKRKPRRDPSRDDYRRLSSYLKLLGGEPYTAVIASGTDALEEMAERAHEDGFTVDRGPGKPEPTLKHRDDYVADPEQILLVDPEPAVVMQALRRLLQELNIEQDVAGLVERVQDGKSVYVDEQDGLAGSALELWARLEEIPLVHRLDAPAGHGSLFGKWYWRQRTPVELR